MELKKYNITVIGDSICKGIEIINNKVSKLEKNAINEIEKYFDIKIQNNSLYGQSLKRVYQKGLIDKYIQNLNKNEHNLLVISMGGNDSDFDWVNVSKTPKENHTSKTTLEEFNYYIEDITIKLLENNVKTIYTTLFPIDSKRYFENTISNICEGSKVLDFFNNDITNISRYQQLFSDSIILNCFKYGLFYLDIRSDFLKDVKFLDKVCNDGAHPNNLGQLCLKEIVIDQLEKK